MPINQLLLTEFDEEIKKTRAGTRSYEAACRKIKSISL